MSLSLTRRDFLSDVALAGAASALKLKHAPEHTATDAGYADRRNNFDAGWLFMQSDVAGAAVPDFADSAWAKMDLPHDWSITGAYAKDAPAGGSGAFLPTGIAWYRKHFTLPAAAAGKHVRIEFDGVYQRSEVFINGLSLGMRPYGFISFHYDLTPHLNPPGKDNVLAVRVDNSMQPNCRWYTGSGIYRHTWLRVTDALQVAPWGTYVRAEAVSPVGADVLVDSRLLNQGTRSSAFELLVEVLDAQGKVVQHATAEHSLDAGAEQTVTQKLHVASPALWSPGSPAMYQVRTSVRVGGRVVDQDTTPFGIREAHFDAERGFLLNGEHYKLNGVCLHGDCGCVGTAVPERMWERRLQTLRQMGCNAIRLSHNPPAPELLDMLDRMGFLVMAEAFDEWQGAKQPKFGYHLYFDKWHERDLTAMLERDRNHPSIVIWSAGNEVRDQLSQQGVATLESLLKIFRRLDPTRPVTVGCDGIAAEPRATSLPFLEALDVVGYNYVDRWRDRREKMYSIDHQAHPAWKLIGTESSAPYGARGVYGVDQSNHDFPDLASNTLIEVEQQQKFVQTYDYVSGDFLWTGIDYLGEAVWPAKLTPSGSIDTAGFPKDSFYLFQSLWQKEPVLHVFPHWNWAGREGEMIPVSCFTNCDTVELFLNGKSLGVKGFTFPRPGMEHQYGELPARGKVPQTTADLHLSWDVVYMPGTLKAVGVRAGEVVRTAVVETTGAPAKLSLTADRDRIRPAGGDVAHVTVTILDAQGRMVPTAGTAVTFAVSGAGRLLGVDSGEPANHAPFGSNPWKAFNGLAMAILQPTGRRGSIELRAFADSLEPAKVTVFVD